MRLPGEKFETKYTLPVDVAADVAHGQVGTLTDVEQAAVAGVSDYPSGVFVEDIDVTQRTRTSLVTKGFMTLFVDAAVTDLTIPLTVAQLGRVTPATLNAQVLVGKPLTKQSTIGGAILVDLSLLGTYNVV